MANFNALVAMVVRAKRRMDSCGGRVIEAQRELTQADNDYKKAVADLDDEIHKACMPDEHPSRALPEPIDLPPPVIELRTPAAPKTIAAKVASAQSAPVIDGKRSIRCGHCHKPGHHAYRCPERKEP